MDTPDNDQPRDDDLPFDEQRARHKVQNDAEKKDEDDANPLAPPISNQPGS